jgi:hypothetical protein
MCGVPQSGQVPGEELNAFEKSSCDIYGLSLLGAAVIGAGELSRGRSLTVANQCFVRAISNPLLF